MFKLCHKLPYNFHNICLKIVALFTAPAVPVEILSESDTDKFYIILYCIAFLHVSFSVVNYYSNQN